MPVRSGFGGVAIYDAAVWFNKACSYSADARRYRRYAGEDDMRACEHVVFHECLHETTPGLKFGISKQMQTGWDLKSEDRQDILDAGDVIVRTNPLQQETSAHAYKNMLRVNNTQLTLLEDGNMMITRSGKEVWRSNVKKMENMTGVVLVLQGDGNLVLYGGWPFTGETALWGSGTSSGAQLVLEEEGVLSLRDKLGSEVWSSPRPNILDVGDVIVQPG